MFVLLFAFVFGGAIPLAGGGSYREYLMPGIYVQTLAFASITTAMAWIGVLLGLLVKTLEVAQQLGFLVIFPLTFLSNAFVPTETLPGVLQPIAEWNPISALVGAMRDLFGNPNPFPSDSWPADHALLLSFAWTIGLLAVFAPLAVRRYRAIER